MTALAIHLLGKFHVTHNGEPVTALALPRLQSLFAYLALHRGYVHTRQQLAFLFWPDTSEAQARTNLRKQLLFLRQALPAADDLLRIDRHTVQLNPTAIIHVDVTAFKEALTRVDHLEGTVAVVALREAVTLYTGDLLPGCYDEWLLAEREALRETYLGALGRLMQRLEAARAYLEAIGYAQQLLRHDPLHELAYRHLMRLHALNEDRAAALRVYHTCTTRLRTELDVPPHPDTQALYEQILKREAPMSIPQPAMTVDAPFVGRQAEWQTLQQAWQRAARGEPNFVLIGGEAGIGKTRLAQELRTWAEHQGFITAHARSYAAEGRLAYAPVITWLRCAALKDQWSQLDPTWLTELARLVPEILVEQPQTPPPSPLTDDGQRHRLFEALARATLAGDEPLLLVLDDLQWSDQETLQWLHFLLRFAASPDRQQTSNKNRIRARFLIVGTVRTDEVLATHPLLVLQRELEQENLLSTVGLSPLSATETGALVNQMLPSVLDTEETAQLYHETEGHPLFVVETMRAYFTTNGDAHNRVTDPPRSAQQQTANLPSKILAMIAARLAQLSPLARKVAELAAVVGREFTFAVLAKTDKADEDQLVEALDELWQRHIIREQGGDAYDFSHDKLREVAYNEISAARRRLLHRHVADALASVYANNSESIAAQLAAHYEKGGGTDKAILYYQEAGKIALDIFANSEGIEHLEHALALLHSLPESQRRETIEYSLLVAIAPPLVAQWGYGTQQLREVCLRVQALGELLKFPANPAILRILAIACVTMREFEQVYRLGHTIIELAYEKSDEPDLILKTEGLYVLGVAAFWQGNYVQARTYLEQVAAIYDAQYHHIHIVRYGKDPAVTSLSRLAWALWFLGYPDQAAKRCNEALTLAYQLNHGYSISVALVFAAWINNDRQDQAANEPLIALIIEDHQPYTSLSGKSLGLVLQGWSNVQGNDPEPGIEQIRAGITASFNGGYELMFGPYFLAVLGRAYLHTKQYDKGIEALDQALVHVNTYADRYYEAELLRVKGELLLAKGAQTADAETCFQQALALSQSQAAKSLELRSAMSLARLWQKQGKGQAAHQLLAEIYGWFTEGFDTPDLLAAKALLEKLGH